MQNNTVAIIGYAKAQNNITATPNCAKPNWVDIEHKLKELLKFEYQDAICENLLLLLSYSLLYLDFDNACHKDYSG